MAHSEKSGSDKKQHEPKEPSIQTQLSEARSLADFTACVQRIDAAAKGGRKEFTRCRITTKKTGAFQTMLDNLRDEDWQQCLDFMSCCLRINNETIVGLATSVLEHKNLLDWKGHPELIECLISTLIDITQERLELEDVYEDFSVALMRVIKENNLLKVHATAVMSIIQTLVTAETHRFKDTAFALAKNFSWQRHMELTKGILQDINLHIETMVWSYITARSARLLKCILKTIQNSKKAEELLPTMTSIYMLCVEADWHGHPEDHREETPWYKILKTVMEYYFHKHQPMKPRLCQSILPSVLKLAECEDEDIHHKAMQILSDVVGRPEIVTEEQAETFIQFYLQPRKHRRTGLDCDLSPLFTKFPAPFCERMEQFMDTVEDDSAGNNKKHYTLQLFWEIGKTKPQAFSTQVIKTIVELLPAEHMAALILQSLAEKRPRDILPFDRDIMLMMKENDSLGYIAATTLGYLSMFDQTRAKVHIKVIIMRIESTTGQMKPSFLNALRTIALHHPKLVAEHRDQLLQWKKEPSLAEMVRLCLDAVEGRSLEDMSKQLAEQRQVMDDLESRVAYTEDSLAQQVDGDKGGHRPPPPPRPQPKQCSGCARVSRELAEHDDSQQRLSQEVSELRDLVQELSSKYVTGQQETATRYEQLVTQMSSEMRQLKEETMRQAQMIKQLQQGGASEPQEVYL